jgi:SPOR domain
MALAYLATCCTKNVVIHDHFVLSHDATGEKMMRQMQCMQSLVLILVLSGCTSGQSSSSLSRTGALINQTPMTADTKSYAREFFDRPDPKALAFSPEKGTAWAAWGSSSVENAKEFAVSECERRTRTPCTLFAVNQQIVWEPVVEPTPSNTPGDRPAATSGMPDPVVKFPPATHPASASAAKPEVPPPAKRVAIHVASVRSPTEASKEWQRLAKRYQFLAGLEMQAPRKVDVPGKGVFYRVVAGAFHTRAQALAICEEIHSAGGYCTVVGL